MQVKRKISGLPAVDLACSLVVILFITCYPYIKMGLSGYFPDLMYHLLRIEAVKDSLMHGEYPAKIYTMFYGGYGYGSPLFYPDILLTIPALFRMVGIDPILTWKLFSAIICLAASLSTFFSIKYVIKNTTLSITGLFLVMLSQFYLADLHNRVGLSEYMAYIFIPILFAGIYDFFVYEKNYTWLFIISAVGLVLTHTIMTLLAVLFCVIFSFVYCLISFFDRSRTSAERDNIFSVKKFKGILVALCGIIGMSSYYLFPMIEQMKSDAFRYSQPWAYVGENTQPLSVLFRIRGYFNVIAYVGIGIPMILLFLICLPGVVRKEKDLITSMFFFIGPALFLITTGIFPWSLFNHTFLNSLQFTYRIYPYAIMALSFGIVMHLNNQLRKNEGEKRYITVIVALSMCFFGILQNDIVCPSEESKMVTEAYLYDTSNYSGAGEWLPIDVSDQILDLNSSNKVLAGNNEIDFFSDGSVKHSFTVDDPSEQEYEVPLIYYKGYRAYISNEAGDRISLPLCKSDDGKIIVSVQNGNTGVVTVEYYGTLLQKISLGITIITICIFIMILLKRVLPKSILFKRMK